MAIEERHTCDLCGDLLHKPERQRFAVWRKYLTKPVPQRIANRRNQDRPESAEYLDIGPCCFNRPIGDLVKLADSHRPEDASGYKA